MKLRILGNSIRLRLSQTEVKALATSQVCSASIFFPNASVFTYRLIASESLDCSFVDQTISISLPKAEINEWANSSQISMRREFSLEKGDKLSILVEKDFKCLSDRGEDERDLFPNPKESH